MNIIETIKERRSVRSFTGQPLTQETIDRLEALVANSFSPFGGSVTIRMKRFGVAEDFKPSTYGVIRGATDYFLVGMGADEESALSVGFRFEQVVLGAWQMGLGTCWIAGTFKGSDFDRGETWPDGESLKVISPVGVAGKKRMFENVARSLMGSHKRKPFDELFFTDNFKSPLSVDNTFGNALEMLRLAPSSTNSQPWRCLVDGETVRFYYKPKSKASVIDCGIGMCHFYETELFDGHEGHFDRESSVPQAPDGWLYLRTYRRTK